MVMLQPVHMHAHSRAPVFTNWNFKVELVDSLTLPMCTQAVKQTAIVADVCLP